jgi:flagellar hook-associated protein 3 FlgL
MRISTSTLFDVNVASLNTQQSKLLQINQQIASGRRILTPADDPAAAARALQVTQSDATNTQYLSNIGTTQDSASLSEGVLGGVTTLIQNIQSTAVSAGNPGFAFTDRKILASTLQDNLNQLVSLANTKDGVGNYLFSGFKGSTQPFVDTSNGVKYNGDDGQRLIQVSSNRQLAASDSGSDIFMRIKNGNGTFVTQPVATNTGSGVVSLGSLGTPPPTASQTGNAYTLSFAVAAGVTTYSVTGTDSTGAALPTATQPGALPTAVAYTSGQSISFNGVQFDIQGTPANGDQFTVKPSTYESVFQTISDFINTLNTPTTAGSAASAAQLSAGINRVLGGMDNALNNVLTTRASLGSRLNELTALQTTGADLGNQYKQTLSNLQDVDYNKAITDLTQQTTMLQAAQKSFLQVQNLSMFNYMP